MEIIVIALIIYFAYKFNLIGGALNVYKKSIASLPVQSLLEHQHTRGFLGSDPNALSNKFIEDAWEKKPDIFEGKFGQRPHKLSAATYALALGAQRLTVEQDDDSPAVTIALGNALSELDTNGNLYPFKAIDHELIKQSMAIYMGLMQKYNNRELAEQLSIRKDDPSNGIIYMQDFPYNTFEEWDRDYREAAALANDSLKPLDETNGKSLIDFLEEEPVRKAYADKLDPKALGKKFGETFDPLKMGWTE